MIVKIPLVLALVTYTQVVLSASFSKVYVQNGPDYPVEYIQYGAPSVSYSPHIAQLTAAPEGSVVPYPPNYVPCGTPCVYPGVASVAPSAQIVQYPSPSLPIVATTRSKPSGYEYSYVVYDEQTGDHKTQSELSDGSSVRGSYSFLQPDGYIREVQYVADDVQGFNAVVKNYLPVTVETKKHGDAEKPEVEPCHEIKNDHLNEKEGNPETDQKSHHRKSSHENLKAHHEETHSETTEDTKHEQPHAEHQKTHEEHHEVHVEPHEELNEPHKEHHETHEEHHKTHGEPHEEHNEAHEENIEAEVEPYGKHHNEHHDINTEPVEELIVVIEEHHVHDKPRGEHEEVHVEHHSEERPAPEHHKEVHMEHPQEEHETHISHSESNQEEPESSEESESEPEIHENHEHHSAVAEHDIENSNILVPYNDIIRCIQAALSRASDASSPHKAESPLTYIILNKLC